MYIILWTVSSFVLLICIADRTKLTGAYQFLGKWQRWQACDLLLYDLSHILHFYFTLRFPYELPLKIQLAGLFDLRLFGCCSIIGLVKAPGSKGNYNGILRRALGLESVTIRSQNSPLA